MSKSATARRAHSPRAPKTPAPPPAARAIKASDPAPVATRARKGKEIPPPPDPNRMMVRALMTGYYADKRWREGDIFRITDVRHFSTRWMEWVDPRSKSRITTGAQALRQFHDQTMKAKAPGFVTDEETPGLDASDDNPLGAE